MQIRQMTAADIPFGMHLKSEAHWNQTEADWRRFLDIEPDGCFLAECEGQPAGTVVTAVFDGVGWIAMVLVEPQLRGRGIGTTLMTHAMAYLEDRNVATMRLDATPLGLPVYEKLGFHPEYRLARFEGTPHGVAADIDTVAYAPQHLETVLALDLAVVGADRGKLISRLLADNPDATRLVMRDGEVAGYATARPGARATFLGPCIAPSLDAGQVLVADLLERYAGQPVFVDVPLINTAAVTLAEAAGLAVQRRLQRMFHGTPPAEKPEGIWTSSGPEMG